MCQCTFLSFCIFSVYISTTRIWECEFHSTLGRGIWNLWNSWSEQQQFLSSKWMHQGKRRWSHKAMLGYYEQVQSFSCPSKNREEGANLWKFPCFLLPLSPSFPFPFSAFLITCFPPLLKNIYIYHNRIFIKYRNVKVNVLLCLSNLFQYVNQYI